MENGERKSEETQDKNTRYYKKEKRTEQLE